MNEKVKISIIMPSLNVAGYIGEAIESVCRQTLEAIEIICIDAGSTDGTVEIIQKAKETDGRIKLFFSDIKSYGYQVNLGIEKSSGEYIQVVETDDHIDSDMCRILYEAAENRKVDYIKADYKAFFCQDNGEYYYFTRHTFTDQKMYNSILKPIDNPIVARDDWYLWQGIYRRDYLNEYKIRFTESKGAAFQDIGFLFWSGVFAKNAIYLHDELYHYRIGRQGASSNQIKGLFYSAYEFDNMLKKLNLIEKIDSATMRMLYIRMSRSFISCIDRIRNVDESLNDDFIETYNWFCLELKKSISNNYISETVIGKDLWSKLLVALDSYKSYYGMYILKPDNKVWDLYHKFIVCGCGEFGFWAYNELKESNKQVVGFFDNNEKLWGTCLNGIQISKVLKSQEVSDDIGIIIANEFHFMEIKKQLLDYGYSENRVMVFR